VTDDALPILTIAQHGRVRHALHVLDDEARRVKAKYGAWVDADDLTSKGKLALYQCALRFDPQVCASFEGYARFRVRGAMLNHIALQTIGARVRRRMARAGAERVATYHDDYDVMRHDRAEFQRRLDLMCDREATAMLLAGGEQARREAGDDPEAAAEYAETIGALERVVAPLSEDERKLLDLVYASDFNLEDAAASLGVVKNTAWRRIHRLLEKLRVALRALGITQAPEPMKHPSVRAVLVPRTPVLDEDGRETGDIPEVDDETGDPEKQR
jgi:RNA polymerase sigma factor for flagellar operon FliA